MKLTVEKLKKFVIALSIRGVSKACFSHTVEKQMVRSPKSINMKGCESPSQIKLPIFTI